MALGLPLIRLNNSNRFVSSIDNILTQVKESRENTAKNRSGANPEKTSVDLCFIIDCTGSVSANQTLDPPCKNPSLTRVWV